MPNELSVILSGQPAFRWRQIYDAWFDTSIGGYGEITTLTKELRERLKDIPWLSVKLENMAESETDGVKKALLRLADGELIETVLMKRESRKEDGSRPSLILPSGRGGDNYRHTICVSSQVGCAMNCSFCFTGKLGFKRNLTAEEIVDQYRFWGTPANIVLMGQGEPLLNYDNVKGALNILIKHGKVGPSKITISTVGVKSAMEKMLADKDFPATRFAVSLHSAVESSRVKLIPSHQKGFLEFLAKWSADYHKKFSSRALFLGLEYIMLKGVNDDDKHLSALIKLASKLGRIRINLIPHNGGKDALFLSSPDEVIKHWRDRLMQTGFVVTIRRSQGQDIAAACGQLAKNYVLS